MFRWLILAILFYWLWQLWKRASQTTAPHAKPRSKAAISAGEMVACKTCGVYVLKNNTLQHGDNFFCSDACRRKG